MQYDISITKDIACMTLEGNLNALDLMFMFQSNEYKDVIKQYKKIIIDYTNICGSTLTAQDAIAIAMLGKMGVENIGKITVAMAINENDREVLEKITKSIFSDSQTNILVTDSRSNALKLLN